MKWLIKKHETVIFLILVVLCISFSLYSKNFLTKTNILNILVGNVPLAIIAIGMTLVIITGGIDISVASQMMVSATILAHFSFLPAANVVTVVVLALLCGIVMGAINGFLITKFNVPPIIITLATNNIYRGLTFVITRGTWVMDLPKWFTSIGKPDSGFPLTIIYTFILFVVTDLFLKYTTLGRSIYAIGGNLVAAKYAGINTKRTIFFTYTYCGALCGIAGLLLDCILGSLQPSGGSSLMMSSIAAVVVGGTNILGGSGSMVGTAISVALMGVIENGLVILRVSIYYKVLFYGLLLTIAIVVLVLRENNAKAKQQIIEIFDVKGEK